VPSDWTIYIVYSSGDQEGSLSVKTRVTKFTKEDKTDLKTIWGQTLTKYLDAKE